MIVLAIGLLGLGAALELLGLVMFLRALRGEAEA